MRLCTGQLRRNDDAASSGSHKGTARDACGVKQTSVFRSGKTTPAAPLNESI